MMASIWQCIFFQHHDLTASGAIEPQFYASLLKGLELSAKNIPDRNDPSNWSELRNLFTQIFLEKSQSECESVFDGTDSCVTPISPLSMNDNRPVAGLSESPGLDVGNENVEMLHPGVGTSGILQDWVGWANGIDYTVGRDGTVYAAHLAKL